MVACAVQDPYFSAPDNVRTAHIFWHNFFISSLNPIQLPLIRIVLKTFTPIDTLFDSSIDYDLWKHCRKRSITFCSSWANAPFYNVFETIQNWFNFHIEMFHSSYYFIVCSNLKIALWNKGLTLIVLETSLYTFCKQCRPRSEVFSVCYIWI